MTDRRIDKFLHSAGLSGVPSDYLPVAGDDDADNCGECVGLYIQNSGNVTCTTLSGDADRVIRVGAGTFLPGLFTRVKATGTTATGIFALQL